MISSERYWGEVVEEFERRLLHTFFHFSAGFQLPTLEKSQV